MAPLKYGILNIHYPGTRRVVKYYPGSLLQGYPTGTRGSPTSMNVNVNLELRQSHAQLHMHHR